jgi:tRNA pseudouridine55 synthase
MNTDAMPTDGVIVIDKPPGITSAKAVAIVKKLFHARKAGHTGTLDPMATGILVCCINQATRLARFLLGAKKTYAATLRLGLETDTQDASGEIIAARPGVPCTAQQIASVFRQFEGEYLQTPPAYSALKHRGKPLYRYARSGQTIHKPPRRVEIQSLKLFRYEWPFVAFEVACSSGTYVRTLCADIGQRLGCGGHLTALRRIANGQFNLTDAVTLNRLTERASQDAHFQHLICMKDALGGMATVRVNNILTDQIKHGKIIRKSDLFQHADHGISGIVKVLDSDENLIAVMSQDDQTNRMKYECVFN